MHRSFWKRKKMSTTGAVCGQVLTLMGAVGHVLSTVEGGRIAVHKGRLMRMNTDLNSLASPAAVAAACAAASAG